MDQIIPEAYYTFDASLKTITLTHPYDAVEIAQIKKIKDLDTTEVLYDRELNDEPISLTGGVITHTHGSSSGDQTDSDKLLIIVESGSFTTDPIYITEGEGQEAFDDEVITVADSAIGLTAGTYLTATKAEMTLETAQIRVRKDGSDPTTSVGHLVEVGDQIVLNSASDIANFKAIRTGSTSGELIVTYSE